MLSTRCWHPLRRLCVLCALLGPLFGAARSGPVLEAAIAPQPLAQALTAFIRHSSLQLIYVSSLAAGKRSPGAPAGLAESAALHALLQGTGLRFEYLNEHTVRLAAVTADSARPAADGAAPSVSSTAVPEEILVTAMKRDTLLSRLPMSARVLTAEDMSAQGLRGIADVSAVTPGTQYEFNPEFHPGLYAPLTLRGIAAGKGEPTTGIYVDDTPIQMPYSSLSYVYPVTFDLARVEVLRGPQGVLFGRGAEGGAVRFITHEPSLVHSDVQVHAEAAATEGGGMSAETGVAAGGPLLEGVLGARVSAWYREEGGYVDRINPFTGATVDADSNRSWIEAFRLSVAYQPTALLRVTPTLSYQSAHAHDTPVFYSELSSPGAGVFENAKLLRQPSVDSETIATVKVEDRLPAAALTAVTSYVERRANAIYDDTNDTGVQIGGYGNPLGPEFPSSYADANAEVIGVHQRLLAEEVRLASVDSAGRFSGLAGLFYSRLRQNYTDNQYLATLPDRAALIGDSDRTQAELSLFGQADLAFARHWKLGAGVRIGWGQDSGDTRSGGYEGTVAFSGPSAASWKSVPVLPRYSLAYEADAGDLYYASVSRGYRGGGGNAPAQCGDTPTPATYGPDAVWSYEIGAKSRWWAQRLQLTASVYDVQWTDVQLHLYDRCGNGFTTNQGAAVSSGFDLGADARLGEHLRLTLALGFNEIHFTQTVFLPGDQVIAVRGTSGGVPDVPAPWTGTLTGEYRWPLTPAMSAFVRAEDSVESHNPGPFTEQDPRYPYYDPRIRADPAISVVNVHVGVSGASVELSAFVMNALDRQPLLQLYADAPGSQLLYAYSLRPRTIGLHCTWRH